MTTPTQEALMALADRYAHVYSFVGCDTMPQARAALASAIAEVVRDVARLDWLEGQRKAYGFQDIHEGNEWAVDGPFANVRAAIDAARSAAQKTAGV